MSRSPCVRAVYQSFLMGVTVLLALTFLVAGLLLGRKLRAVKIDEEGRRDAKATFKVRSARRTQRSHLALV